MLKSFTSDSRTSASRPNESSRRTRDNVFYAMSHSRIMDKMYAIEEAKQKRPHVSSMKGRKEQHNVINIVPTWIASCSDASEPSLEQCIAKATRIADLLLL